MEKQDRMTQLQRMEAPLWQRTAIMLLFLVISVFYTCTVWAKAPAPGVYRIASAKKPSLFITVENGLQENHANLGLGEKASDGRDLFRIKAAGNNSFQIVSLLSGRAVTMEGENIEQFKWKSKKEQFWQFEAAGKNRYYIIGAGNQAIGLEKGRAADGNNVVAVAAKKKLSQRWMLVPAEDFLTVSSSDISFTWKTSKTRISVTASEKWKAASDSRWLTAKKSGASLILTAKKNGGEDRSALVTVSMGRKTKKISVTQKSKANTTGKKTAAKGTYYFLSALSSQEYGLTVRASQKQNGTNAMLTKITSDANKQFQLKYVSDGAYCILAKHSGKCLETDGTGNVYQWKYDGSVRQLWELEDAGNGAWYIRSRESGKYLTVQHGKGGEGVNVYTSSFHKAKSQRWILADITKYAAGYKYLWKSCGKPDVTDAFLEKTLRIARAIGADPDDLMAVMAFESLLSHTIINPNSGATGLSQFLPSTAASLGTTTANLRAMSAVDQLDYVQMYLSRYAGRYNSLGSLYMAVLWPYAVGQGDNYVLWTRGGTYNAQYGRNSGLDVNKDGAVTVGEAVQKVLANRKRFVGV